MFNSFREYFEYFILAYFFLLNSAYFVLLIASFKHVQSQIFSTSFSANVKDLIKPAFIPGISILVPAYNEAKTIINNIHSLCLLQYPHFEIVVINDGSSDKTIELLKKEFQLTATEILPCGELLTQKVKKCYVSKNKHQLIVIDKENGGKADALNCGLNYANYDYFCSIDADVILSEDAIVKLMRPFLENPQEVIATGGIVRIANNCLMPNGKISETKLPNKLIPGLQVVEYVRAFLFGRVGFSIINGLLIISGALGAFSTQHVRRVGGYDTRTVSEDMELIMKLHEYMRKRKKKYSIKFIADPVCWTEVPDNIEDLANQRNRWHRGLCESLWSYKHMFLNPRYGALGLIAFPYYLLFEFLGPLIEFAGYIYVIIMLALGYLNVSFYVLFFSLAILYSMFLSLASVLLEDVEFRWYTSPISILKLSVLAVYENIGYRQLLTFSRVWGFVDFLRGRRDWGKIERSGYK